MIRINKLTDYGIVIAVHIASDGPERLHTAREIAAGTRIPQPTVTRLLKQLARSSILTSTRGASGGYSLAQPPEAISVARLVETGDCATEVPWQPISLAVREALDTVTLADMVRPLLTPPLVPLGGIRA